MPFADVPQDVKFPEEEEKILKYWDDIDAFQESLRWVKEAQLECAIYNVLSCSYCMQDVARRETPIIFILRWSSVCDRHATLW